MVNYNMFDSTQLTSEIKQLGANLGFAKVGIADANRAPAGEREYFQSWLQNNYHGGMQYLNVGYVIS